MKKLILLTILLFQLTFIFGQCTTTQGAELSESVTYFKCQNGYEAPVGYEWMKPTKIYIVPYQRGTNARPRNEANLMVHMENFFRGNDLQEANTINAYIKEKYGYSDVNYLISGRPYKVICLDCGLGYFATVSLADGFETHDNFSGKDSYPNVGFGYACGQPTIEEAIKVAYKAAKEQLKTAAVSFSFNAGVNTSVKLSGSLTNILYQTFGDTDASQSHDYAHRGSGYSKIPETPDEFLEYIISLNKLSEQKGNEYGIKRNDDLSYTKFWKQGAKGHEEITNNEYPVFTDKIGSSSKQIGQNTSETIDNSKNADDAVSINNSGVIALNEKRIKDAELLFLKALDLNPNDKNSYNNLIYIKSLADVKIVEEMKAHSSNLTVYDKLNEKRIKLLKEIKSLSEKYILIDNTNQDINDNLTTINKYLAENNSTNENSKIITSRDLLNNLKNKSADKLKIFKDFFIQEGYEFVGSGVCTNFFETGSIRCIKFSDFSIYQNKKGMVGIMFGNNETQVNKIKNKLNSVENSFVLNEFHDRGKVDYILTFNQGQLLFYNK